MRSIGTVRWASAERTVTHENHVMANATAVSGRPTEDAQCGMERKVAVMWIDGIGYVLIIPMPMNQAEEDAKDGDVDA